MALEFEGRDVVFGLGQQVHGQEPGGQWQFGGLEDRLAHDRCLLPACRALPVRQSLAFKGAMARLSAVEADY